jgi:hypothetical protein
MVKICKLQEGREVIHCRAASSLIAHIAATIFVGIEGAHCGSVGGGGELMEWARILAYITGTLDQELLLRNEYLAAENRILKAQLQGRLRLSDAERATLGEIGHRLGRKALGEGATAALPDTILGWYRKLVARKFDGSRVRRAPGRPPISKEIQELIVRMPKENRSWGYDRIVGALANLGYQVSDQTVGNVLRCHGIPQAFLATDLQAQPGDILAWFVSRWQVEVTFEEVRAHLGVETQRQWSDKAILRTTPILLGLFSIVTLWAHDLSKSRKLKPRTAAWYPKAVLTFSDAIAAVRREIWAHQISFMSRPHRDSIEIPRHIWHRMQNALAYAA